MYWYGATGSTYIGSLGYELFLSTQKLIQEHMKNNPDFRFSASALQFKVAAKMHMENYETSWDEAVRETAKYLSVKKHS